MITLIDDIRIFEYEDDYSDKNSIGDIIEVEKGAFGLVEEKIEKTDEIKLRIIVNTNDLTYDEIINDLLDEICDNPQNNKSAGALIKYFNEKFKK